MRPSLFLTALSCLLLCSDRVTGSPGGAPLSTCNTLMPIHADKHPQSSSPPYQLLPSKGQGRIRLIMGSPEGEGFEGFLILARDVDTGELVGEFNNLPETSARHLECSAGLKVSYLFVFFLFFIFDAVCTHTASKLLYICVQYVVKIHARDVSFEKDDEKKKRKLIVYNARRDFFSIVPRHIEVYRKLDSHVYRIYTCRFFYNAIYTENDNEFA